LDIAKVEEELDEDVGKLLVFSNSEGLSTPPVKELVTNSPEDGFMSSEAKF
jgi:hypothetical protein